jgi:hypothetical protein
VTFKRSSSVNELGIAGMGATIAIFDLIVSVNHGTHSFPPRPVPRSGPTTPILGSENTGRCSFKPLD